MVAKEIPGWPPTAGTCDAATSTSAEPATFKGRKLYSSTFVPIDLDEPSSWFRVVPTALALARCFKARLTLGTVLEDKVAARKSQWSAIGYREMLSTASARLGLLADELRGDS
jgi:hypothetical protein